jgi:branched-chain amino acid transport system permease protein
MDPIFLLEQLLNGLGYGFMLFLLAAGLTLVFGIMDMLNLAHGALFMVGGYVAAMIHAHTGSFVGAVVAAVAVTALLALLLETTLIRRLYKRDHLSQVLATFGLILIADDAVKYIWGPSPMMAPTPAALAGPIQLLPGLPYPAYRIVILVAGLVIAIGLYLLVNKTRAGMLVRAGASNRAMAELMGVRVGQVFTSVFLLSAALAAVAGALMGPISAVQIGMGEDIMIPALVVIVIGGIGSVRGAFVAALLVGLVDTAGRAFLPPLLRTVLPSALAADIGPALASIAMYVLMAAVLVVKPSGLFPARA